MTKLLTAADRKARLRQSVSELYGTVKCIRKRKSDSQEWLDKVTSYRRRFREFKNGLETVAADADLDQLIKYVKDVHKYEQDCASDIGPVSAWSREHLSGCSGDLMGKTALHRTGTVRRVRGTLKKGLCELEPVSASQKAPKMSVTNLLALKSEPVACY